MVLQAEKKMYEYPRGYIIIEKNKWIHPCYMKQSSIQRADRYCVAVRELLPFIPAVHDTGKK